MSAEGIGPSDVSAAGAGAPLPGSSSTLFVRNATGLVRSISQRDNLIIAAGAGVPALFVAYSIFFVFTGLPGGNIYLAALITVPLILAFSYAFGSMTAAIPRSGGDYMIVTRVLTPWLGFVSSFCMIVGGFLLSGAYLGRLAATLGVAPSLQTIGVLANNHSIFQWGTDVANGKGWWFATGVVMFFIAAAAHWAGQRWVRWVIWLGLLASTAGLLVSTLIALFTSRSTFISRFDSAAAPFTGSHSTYNSVTSSAVKAGINLHPAFSWGATVGVVGVFATASVYTYFASFAGGELRQAATRRTGRRMAIGGLLVIVVDVLCIWILLHAWGTGFLTAAYAGKFPAALGSAPSYITLTSFEVGNSVFAAVLSLSFFLQFPLLAALGFLGVTRVIFAYSFDGVLPEKAATVSKRTNAPTVAIAAGFALYLVFLAWGMFVANDLIQILVYATIIQMIPQMLVGLAAVVLPKRRPALYRGSGLTGTVAGVPTIGIAGVSAILAGAFIIWVYFHYSFFGLADLTKFFAWTGGTIVAGFLYYLLARAVRARQGTDLSLVYAEIPPE
jgi:APA family basic amino acid/polyamine antiporter